jgi:hypothetical protein
MALGNAFLQILKQVSYGLYETDILTNGVTALVHSCETSEMCSLCSFYCYTTSHWCQPNGGRTKRIKHSKRNWESHHDARHM